MCIALPMLVQSVDHGSNTAVVALSGNKMTVNISLIDPKVGDYVLVHAGCALEVVHQQQAEEMLDLFAQLEGLTDHDD